ncbi:MAG: hypothetical protein ACP5OU_08540 [Methanothrix sp.]
MPAQSRKYRAQWTSTFFAAGELTRRGYLVAITHGNARFVDLLIQSPNGKSFSIDVKGMSSRNWIPVKKPDQENGDQYYVLVYAPLNLKDGEIPRYFIMSSKEMFEELTKAELEGSIQSRTRVAKGLSEYKAWASGIQFKQAENYKDKWATLPGYEELKEQNP